MNLNMLTIDEIIHYAEAGVIDSVPASVVIELQEKILELEKEIADNESRYDEGWSDAVTAAIDALNNL